MRSLHFTTEAYRDLDSILSYLSHHDPQAATKWLDRVENQCFQLADHPGIGQLRPDLLAGLRFFPLSNYLIFYREQGDGIQVIRIVHGSRDYRATDFC